MSKIQPVVTRQEKKTSSGRKERATYSPRVAIGAACISNDDSTKGRGFNESTKTKTKQNKTKYYSREGNIRIFPRCTVMPSRGKENWYSREGNIPNFPRCTVMPSSGKENWVST